MPNQLPPPEVAVDRLLIDKFHAGYVDAYRELAPYLDVQVRHSITDPKDLLVMVDIEKYSSFNDSKRAGLSFDQLVFRYID